MFLILCLYSFGVFAQNVTVRGLVSDTQGEPLIGVTVRIEGTSQGTITGMDGRYVLANTPSDATLLFSYVGTKPQAVKVNGRTTINITLVEDVEMLEDVVVVAYGVQKKVAVTGAISSVSTDELRVSSSASIANALAGRVAGLTSMQRAGGRPGADDATMYLRGAATLNGVTPLILIDGVPRDNIRTIDVNEVESISVLTVSYTHLDVYKRQSTSRPKITR